MISDTTTIAGLPLPPNPSVDLRKIATEYWAHRCLGVALPLKQSDSLHDISLVDYDTLMAQYRALGTAHYKSVESKQQSEIFKTLLRLSLPVCVLQTEVGLDRRSGINQGSLLVELLRRVEPLLICFEKPTVITETTGTVLVEPSAVGYERLYAACRNAIRQEIVKWCQDREIGVPPEIENELLSIACLRQILTDLRKPKPAPKAKPEPEPRMQSDHHALLGTVRRRKENRVYFRPPQPFIEETERCPSCGGPVVEKNNELRCGRGCGWTNAPMICAGQFPDPNYKVVWAQPQIKDPTPPPPPKGSGWYQLGSDGITDPLTTLESDARLKMNTKKVSEKRLNEFLKECEWRKNHFWNWRELLRAKHFGNGEKNDFWEPVTNSTDDVLGRVEDLAICPRCGGTCFNRHMGCMDCKLKWHPEWHLADRPTVDQKKAARAGMPETITEGSSGSKRYRRKLTPREFLAGLLLRGTVKKLRRAEELVKAAGSYMVLVEQWLPEDVQEFICSDPGETIKKRADRVYGAVTNRLESGEPLPECVLTEHLDAESVLRLKEILETLKQAGRRQAGE